MYKKVVILPNQEEMLRRLIEVNSTKELIADFYPILLKEAGQRKSAVGIALILVNAVVEYTRNMPPIIAEIIYFGKDLFVDALADDQEVAKDAKDFLRQALSI